MRLFGYREPTAGLNSVTALREISFNVSHGERVGVIGRNGSGKSTLLRAMAGVYPLERGRIEVCGEIGTLLDISLGFEMESTGRENIYNRGMAMGYSRTELKEAEDAIVRFTDIGEFIDLPMRTYSSGMCIRLGFAISTHFVPDILLIDEVIGAGDGVFSRRAVDRIDSIVSESGIVVLVSHDMNALNLICDRLIWLDQGKIVMDGPKEVVFEDFARFVERLSSSDVAGYMPLEE